MTKWSLIGWTGIEDGFAVGFNADNQLQCTHPEQLFRSFHHDAVTLAVCFTTYLPTYRPNMILMQKDLSKARIITVAACTVTSIACGSNVRPFTFPPNGHRS